MTQPKTLMVDDVKYVREDSIKKLPELTGDKQIVVVEGRWNLIGITSRNADGDLVIEDAKVIRYWGTTRGLGQLAMEGPTGKTKLDETGRVTVPAHAVIMLLDVNQKAWS